jgi:hypothetical protein
MQTHHVQRELRRVPANSFAVSGKAYAALFHSTRMRQSNVDCSNRLFFAAAARAGNSSDADA